VDECEALVMGGASEVTDGRDEGKWRVGGSYKGTSSREEDLKVRFWNLWGGSSECRAGAYPRSHFRST
jgi:hypothetical protein